MSHAGPPGSLNDHDEVFRLVFEAAPNGIVVIDESGTVVLVNRQAEKMFGYERQEFIGLRIEDLVPERLRPAHVRHREEFSQSPSQRAMGIGRDLRARRKDGSEFPVEIGLTPVRSPTGMLVVSSIVDTTERTRTENELRRYAAELERSNADLRNFAHVASHDLREPLRKITAFGDRLRKHCEEALDERGRDYLQRMTDASHRMQGLIEDLLAFSRVSMHRLPAGDVDLNEVLDTVLEDLEIGIGETGAVIERTQSLPLIQADRSQMGQLFQNLVGNALKFHQPGQPPRLVVTATSPTPGRVRLEFRDHGIGFEPRYAERVFGIFQRLHGRNEYEGTGVGLAICRKIVELHHGTITALGEPGVGATFVLDLPLQQPGSPAP
ncbi:MAG: PAS domain S-box protein [Verrucomicrobia bacterium]|nr:PAS domain S-box protein [Verrucomicrobiota bacterium]